MTIPSTARKAGPFDGTGVQTEWPFTFKVFTETDVKVVIADAFGVTTDLVYLTDFTVALNADQETSPGGTVTYPISGTPLPDDGSVLSIAGNATYEQALDLPSGGNFSPLAIENALDAIVMQIQQLAEEISRAARLPITSAEDAESLVADIVVLADNVTNMQTLVANIADIVTVADDLNEPVSEINTVAGSITNVNTVGNNIANVNTVAGISANVTTVAGIQANVTTVAGIAPNVTTVAGISTNVTTVASIDTEVTTVAGISGDVSAVAAIDNDVSAVAAVDTGVVIVAAVATDVATVAANIADVQVVADNIDVIASKANAGANSDITSLSGLTTALSISQGGTGADTEEEARVSLGLELGVDVQPYDADTAKLDVDQTWSGAQRGAVATDNDGSFDQAASNNFQCTPTGTFALTFTNHTAGQSGYVLLINTGGYAVTAAATTKVGASTLAAISAAGTYLLSYYDNGTNAYVTSSGALA